ncbi:MAG: metallophosphoesterase [Bacteroidales bacterium]|nr:metallophosphoesterase [Bacteroidales bacterium]
MEILRLLSILMMIFVLSGCNNDLDESGFLHSKYSVEERFEMSQNWLSLNPAKHLSTTDSTYSIFFFSDSHIGTSLEVRQMLNKADTAATGVMGAGDICRGHVESYDSLEAVINDYPSLPIFMTTGNHDLYFGNWSEFYSRFGASSYYFTVTSPAGSDIFIMLDSGSGTLGASQLNWLTDLLKTKRSLYRNCIIATHLNFFRDGMSIICGLPPEELYPLMDLFIDYNVNYVVSGHEHKRYENKLGPTQFITLESLHDEESNSSWMELEISNAKSEYRFISSE